MLLKMTCSATTKKALWSALRWIIWHQATVFNQLAQRLSLLRLSPFILLLSASHASHNCCLPSLRARRLSSFDACLEFLKLWFE
jgi:hypothetical protein